MTLPLEALPKRPLFMEKRGLTAAERGDAAHAFLRAVSLDAQDLDMARRIMVERGMLSVEQAQALPMTKLERMITSPLWKRMRAAQTLYRERPFNLRVQEAGYTTLLQGVIDCCFLEAGEWVVVDFKSDRAGDPVALAERYGEQVALYARALCEITGIPVRERLLYLIEHEETISV